MLGAVASRKAAHNNASLFARFQATAALKLAYYHVLVFLYRCAGRMSDCTVANGSWTAAHVRSLWGVEVRTVERALLVDRGEASVSFAAGSFDARRVIDLHWDRMLPPQRRGAAGAGVERIEGMLGGRPVALSTDAACGLLARAERDPRLVDRLVDRPAGGEPDPAEMVRWHVQGAPAEVESPEAAALTTTLRWTELRADPAADGLRVTVVLAGPLPANTPARMTRLLVAMAASPLGAAVGADDWLHPTDGAWGHAGDEWRGEFVIPWRGLRALVGLARGAVEAPNRREF
jgi:hypothetical protein